MQSKLTEKINLEIMENELSSSDWEHNELAWELIWWVYFFNAYFFKGQPVPIPALTFEKTRINNLGYFRVGLNDWAVRNQINLNKLYLNRPLFEVLATLLHECVHSWEFTYIPPEKRTKSWYHSKAFRDKMAELGILCNNNGIHAGLDYKGKFFRTLKQHAVEFNVIDIIISDGRKVIPIDTGAKKKGQSKLKKWTCGCTNIWVAVQDLKAECHKCRNRFERVS